MGQVLKRNVVLRQNPPSGPLTVLKAGEKVPEWAEDRLGKHLFEDGLGDGNAPKEVDRKLVTLPEVAPKQEEELKVPSRAASAAVWRKFAKAGGTQLPQKITRDEIIEKVLIEHPDLEIPEG